MDKVLEGKKIFISYIEENRDVAHIIWNRLSKLGAEPWAYTKNNDAVRWREKIVQVIRDSDIMVLVFSSKTDEKAHRQIVREIGLASKNNLEIIPFMIDDIDEIENDELAYELEGINWIRKMDPLDTQIDILISRIQKHYGIQKELVISDKNIAKVQKKGLFSKLSLGIVLLMSILIIGMFAKKYLLHENINLDYNKTKQTVKENSKKEIENFLIEFYKAESSHSVFKTTSFYTAEIGRYFDQKNITKVEIIEDKLEYYKKFPKSNFELRDFEIFSQKDIEKGVELSIYAIIQWQVRKVNNDEISGRSKQILKLWKQKNNYLITFIKTVDIQKNKKIRTYMIEDKVPCEVTVKDNKIIDSTCKFIINSKDIPIYCTMGNICKTKNEILGSVRKFYKNKDKKIYKIEDQIPCKVAIRGNKIINKESTCKFKTNSKHIPIYCTKGNICKTKNEILSSISESYK